MNGVRGEFPTAFRDPQRLPKRRREIHLAHRAKNPKTKNQCRQRLKILVRTGADDQNPPCVVVSAAAAAAEVQEEEEEEEKLRILSAFKLVVFEPLYSQRLPM